MSTVFVIRHDNGTYFDKVTAIGPKFGAHKNMSPTFESKRDALQMQGSHYGFVCTTIESLGDNFCDRCGGENIVWFTDSPLWNKYRQQYDVLCIPCFVELVESTGFVPTAWRLTPENLEKQNESINKNEEKCQLTE